MWVVLLVIDLVSKWWVRSRGEFVANQGIAFGVEFSSWFVWVGILVLVYIMWVRIKSVEWGWLFVGGLANLMDRFLWGSVMDWIRIPGIEMWFNLADLYINVGIAWVLGRELANLLVLRHGDKEVI